MEKVYVITATVGTKELETCLKSVAEQDYEGIVEHVVVCDGVEYVPKVREIILGAGVEGSVTLLVLPWNTGRDRFICHKIYAAVPHLLHAPGYIMFLDEDNWIERNHVSSLLEAIKIKDVDWAFALRNICEKDGRFVCRDECESLGNIAPSWLGENDYLVDTSCYMVPLEIARQFSECWQRRAREHPEADRLFYYHLAQRYPKFCSSELYTVNYRLEGRPDSVKAEFFLKGNHLRTLV